jgi:hypothetical protein
MIKNIKIGEVLGHGYDAMVYKGTDNNNKDYALKINYIKKHKIEKWKGIIETELKFKKDIIDKHPRFFVNFYDHEFVEDCYDEKIKKDILAIENDEDRKGTLLKYIEYGMCVKRLYELLDGSLRNNFKNLNLKQRYSMLIQVAYMVHILEKSEYVHHDFHGGNIAFKKTNKEFLKIKGKEIPTFGYQYKLIDYDHVFKLGTTSYTEYKDMMLPKEEKFGNEFITFMLHKILISNIDILIKEYQKENNLTRLRYPERVRRFKNLNISDKFEKLNAPEKLHYNFFIYFFPYEYAKIMLGDEECKKFREKNKDLEVEYSIPLSFKEMTKITKNKNKIKKIIKFFMKKINQLEEKGKNKKF